MNCYKRAFLAIWRRRKTTILLLLILFVLLLSTLMGFSILSGVSRTIDALRQTFGSSFNIELNAAMVEASTVPRDPPEDGKSPTVYVGEHINRNVVERIAQTQGIKQYNAEYELTAVRSNHLDIFPGFWEHTIHDEQMFADYTDEQKKAALAFRQCPKVNVAMFSELDKRFRTNAFELVSGRHFTIKDKFSVVMSEDLAKRNNLKIGDTISLHYDNDVLNGAWPMREPFDVELTVVGLFKINATQIVNEYTAEDEIAQNQLFIDNATAERYVQCMGNDLNYIQATFFVEDPAELDTVMARARNTSDVAWEFFDLTVDETMYQSALEPLSKMQIGLWSAIVFIAVIMLILLYLVIRMSLHSRSKEIKVYHALGIRKMNIFKQLVSECAIIILLAFLPATMVAMLSSQAVANSVLELVVVEPEEIQDFTEEEHLDAIRDGTAAELREQTTALQADHTPQIADISVPVLIAIVILIATVMFSALFVYLCFHRMLI